MVLLSGMYVRIHFAKLPDYKEKVATGDTEIT